MAHVVTFSWILTWTGMSNMATLLPQSLLSMAQLILQTNLSLPGTAAEFQQEVSVLFKNIVEVPDIASIASIQS